MLDQPLPFDQDHIGIRLASRESKIVASLDDEQETQIDVVDESSYSAAFVAEC